LVDVMPIRVFLLAPFFFVTKLFFVSPVRHIPDWVPGAGFKRRASAWATTLREMVDLPHNFVKQQMVSVHLTFTVFILDNTRGQISGSRYRIDFLYV
jgi:hypothetical protein